MARRHYLITYDVADDKRRNRIFQALLDNGNHAQFSVFFCELSRMELAALKSRILSHTHHREDQVMILDLGDARHPLEGNLECLGRAYRPPTRVTIV